MILLIPQTSGQNHSFRLWAGCAWAPSPKVLGRPLGIQEPQKPGCSQSLGALAVRRGGGQIPDSSIPLSRCPHGPGEAAPGAGSGWAAPGRHLRRRGCAGAPAAPAPGSPRQQRGWAGLGSSGLGKGGSGGGGRVPQPRRPEGAGRRRGSAGAPSPQQPP